VVSHFRSYGVGVASTTRRIMSGWSGAELATWGGPGGGVVCVRFKSVVPVAARPVSDPRTGLPRRNSGGIRPRSPKIAGDHSGRLTCWNTLGDRY
jgi:hypothetical protein